jgi:hypothetical protein
VKYPGSGLVAESCGLQMLKHFGLAGLSIPEKQLRGVSSTIPRFRWLTLAQAIFRLVEKKQVQTPQ